MIYRYNLPIVLLIALIPGFLGVSAAFADPGRSLTDDRAITDSLYHQLRVGNTPMPGEEVFARAMAGYRKVNSEYQHSKSVITIIDFSIPSTEKRLWVIDLARGRVLHHTLVAHGRNSGDLFAESFSNTPSSLQSSLGFYVTGPTYQGKHGLSLKLRGLEPGINDMAEARAIVIHGADYVDEDYVRRVGRLGRSWGCPAVPMSLHKEIISELAGGTCLYIHYPDREYLDKSLF